MDMQGDRLIRSRSLALRYGRRAALRVSAGVFGLVVLLSVAPFALRWFTLPYLLPWP
jgi:geranylgeranylglycerol-phosphate geranylgeranyltransferase